jgi:Family of unknown function (DUF6127)
MMDSPITAQITLSSPELELLLQKAAECGAKKALHDIGLHDEEAADDMRELRGILDTWRDTKRTAWKTFVGWFTKGLILVILAGIYMKSGGTIQPPK